VPFAVTRAALPPTANGGVQAPEPDAEPEHAASESNKPAATTTLVNLRTNTQSLDPQVPHYSSGDATGSPEAARAAS
jgi:hypothetical protein